MKSENVIYEKMTYMNWDSAQVTAGSLRPTLNFYTASGNSLASVLPPHTSMSFYTYTHISLYKYMYIHICIYMYEYIALRPTLNFYARLRQLPRVGLACTLYPRFNAHQL